MRKKALTEEKELMPCPFCGGSPVLSDCMDIECGNFRECAGDSRYYAVCCRRDLGGCGASGGYCSSEDGAVWLWNRRVR